ncbi:fibronectin type III domain-containing protein [Myceligenerans xiligouense]|uniref:Fibronectin type 3 domain-containing protein n=1 Tax=Myceligenerans xiligouense TaxID=253184 RepID=A0A3N4ZJY7_9MICO|nr:fibronectin type III domain-containing protein [Myceligenerans xiligouense]RPF20241.1 fibronectin type 3 domain-containing protein [Myceligenerans xiligouense]
MSRALSRRSPVLRGAALAAALALPVATLTAAPAAAAPAAPDSVRVAHADEDSLTIRWNEVEGATGYVLSRADSLDGPWTEVARTDERTVFATDAGIDTGAVHYYRATALGADGESAPSAAGVGSLVGLPDVELPDGGLVLDLGPGAVADGATGLDAATAYTARNRLGWVDPSAVTGSDRGTDDPLRADFVTVGDTELVADLPDGDYTVDVVAGDPEGATDIAITAEQMEKVESSQAGAGEFVTATFRIALVDGQLNLEFAGDAPNLAGLTITRDAEREPGALPTVWVTGDSTVQTYDPYWAPQAGWGQMIERFLSDDVVVTNKAIGGRSSKNFISQGRLDEVLTRIRPGDTLFVQFGHNDNSYGVDDRYAAPADYRNYLRTYVDGARQRGATPVLVTPVSRRSFDPGTGEFNVSFPEYVREASELATELDVPLVDLSAGSRAYLNEIGPEAAKSVFLHVPAGVYPNRPDGTTDDTHFQEYGAIQMARIVARDTAGLGIPLSGEVVDVEPPAAVPPAPTGLDAGSVSNSSVRLTWNDTENTDIYRVFRRESGAGAWTLATTSTIPVADITGLTEGTSYDLRVVAANGRGDSAPSDGITVSTKAALYKFDLQLAGNETLDGWTAVDPTTLYGQGQEYGFTGDAGPGGRDRGIDWDYAPDAMERDFLLPSADTPFAVDLAPGSYAVTAYWGDMLGTARLGLTVEGRELGSSNAGRGSVASKVVQPVEVTDGTLDIIAVGWLNGLTITPLETAVSNLAAGAVTFDGATASVPLTWDETDDAAGYRVYRKAEGAAERETVADVTAGSYTDTTANPGLTYRYTVVTLDGSGAEGIESAPLEVSTVDRDVAVPAAPSALAVGEVDKNLVSLSWDAADEALYYRVLRAGSADEEPVVIGTTAETTFADTGVLTTVPYHYTVVAMNAGGASASSDPVVSPADTLLARQAERIDRSPVAVALPDGGVYVGWRLLGNDPEAIRFHVYRDGERITRKPVSRSTNLTDAHGTADAVYRVSEVRGAGGKARERWATQEFTPWDGQTRDIPLDKPSGGVTPDGEEYTYSANDASVGDVDGDGQYEIVVKWNPSNARDNSHSGHTGNVYLDAYEFDGTRLWRVDLGRNIRAGAHYTQFQVFDYDGDGRAELITKTADGTTDAAGTVIGDARADHRNSEGRVLAGPEFLTVFDGATGVALDTIDYVPPRGDVADWGDGYGNRVDRFLAATAYLDGEHPSAVFSRGYYTRTVIAAFDWDGERLRERWVLDSDESGRRWAGQGNHDMHVADVDGDQLDEIVFGSMTVDDDGTGLYTTRLGHGDAMHVSDLDPARDGLEVFAAHEDMGAAGNRGATFRDAATGEVLWSIPADRDTGRAAAGDIDPRYDGAEAWAIGGDFAWNSRVGELRSVSGELITTAIPAANFLTWWDGDLLREIGDHDYAQDAGAGVPTVSKWDWENDQEVEIYRATGTLSNNSTKGNVSLQADLFGDWREEIVTRTEDSTALRIATTVDPTRHRLRTLMSDPMYRTAVAWQNTAYNQPPHVSYHLGEGMATPPAPRLDYTSGPVRGDRVR